VLRNSTMMTLSIKARTEIGYIMQFDGKLRGKTLFVPTNDASFRVKQGRNAPHEFVLEAVSPLSARTNPMFGCLAVCVGEKIVLMLRDKREGTADNGIWLPTTAEHHQSLRRECRSRFSGRR
jgi:hypothetical protein